MNELQKRQLELKLSINQVVEAIKSYGEYAFSLKPFEHKIDNPTVSKIIETLNARKLGFNADVVLQHIESEIMDQFNDIVKKELKGLSPNELDKARFELEKFSLNSQKETLERLLNDVEFKLLQEVTPTTLDSEPKAESEQKESKNTKKKK